MYIAEEWLTLEKEVLGQRPLISGTVDEIRTGYKGTSESLAQLYPSIDSYRVTDHKELTESGIPIRVYTPAGIQPGTKLPVGVFAHGGGHVAGGAWNSSFEDRMCRYITEHANVIIAQVDFRLAPEYPIPTQLNDCFDAYQWCYKNATKINGDTNRFFSIGSSLGGTVAVGLALKLIDENLRHMVSGVVVLCPALLHPDFVPDEYKPMFKAYEENWIGAPVQDGQSMVLFYGHNGGTEQQANPYAFPCLHPGIHRLPPVYQAICEADPVRDDSTVFKYQLDKSGIRNMFHTYPGMPHYFWLFPQLPSSEVFHQNVVEGVKWMLGQID